MYSDEDADCTHELERLSSQQGLRMLVQEGCATQQDCDSGKAYMMVIHSYKGYRPTVDELLDWKMGKNTRAHAKMNDAQAVALVTSREPHLWSGDTLDLAALTKAVDMVCYVDATGAAETHENRAGTSSWYTDFFMRKYAEEHEDTCDVCSDEETGDDDDGDDDASQGGYEYSEGQEETASSDDEDEGLDDDDDEDDDR